MLAALLPLLALSPSTLANPVQNVKRWPQSESKANCWSFMADVTAETGMNIDLKSVIGYPVNQQALVQGAYIDPNAAGSTVMAQIAAAPAMNVSGTYNMYFEYCQPKTGNPEGVFQTHHGLVGNAGYWNVQLDGVTDYSFAESAAAANWATLSYDRLGVGRSAHPDGTQVVQIAYEIAQSTAIAKMLRDGSVGNGVPQFGKVVGVGHSYGSNLLTGLAASAPDAFDQIILTGFSNNVTSGPLGLAGFMSTIASVAYPQRFGNLANDYVITPSVSNDQIGFFHYPNYTQSALDFFTANKGEYTLGQQNSIAATIALDRSGFTKPVFVITGDNDAPYCTSNCQVTSLGANMTQIDTARPLYPSVADSDFETYAVPATGHAINYHPTSYDAYQRIIAFVTSHAL